MTEYSAWQLSQAISALLGVRRRVLQDDPDLATDEGAIADALGEATEDADAGIRGVIRAALVAEAAADAVARMLDRLEARRARYVKRAEALRGAAFAAMDVLGLKRIEEPDFTVSIGRGKARAVVTDAARVPGEYKRTTTAIDLRALTADLSVGVVVDGAELSNGLPTLTIRSK